MLEAVPSPTNVGPAAVSVRQPMASVCLCVCVFKMFLLTLQFSCSDYFMVTFI